MSSKRKAKNERSFAAGVSIGTLVSLMLSVFLAMIIAALILNERIGERAIEYIAPIIMLLSTLTGCIIAGQLIDEKLAVASGVTGIIYLLILVGVGILFFDGGFHNLWTSILSIAIGCVISCAICIRGKGSRTKRKRPYR